MTLKESHWRVLAADDPEWIWFLRNGPHGSSFNWGQDLPGYNALKHLREIVSERNTVDPQFSIKARKIALEALQSEDINLVRRAIQVLCVVGSDDEVRLLHSFTSHADQAVAKDAKSCLYERRVR